MAIVVIPEKLKTGNDLVEQDYWVGEEPVSTGYPADVSEPTARAEFDTQATADWTVSPLTGEGASWRSEQLSNHSYRFTARYTSSVIGYDGVTPPDPPAAGVFAYSSEFQYQMRSQTLTRQIAAGRKYPTGGQAPDFEGLIGVRNNNGVPTMGSGIPIAVPPVTERVRLIIPNTILTSAYQATIKSLMGKANSVAWSPFFKPSPDGGTTPGFAPNTVALVSATGRPRTILDWEFHFGFADLEEEQVDFKGVSGITKHGNEFIWYYDEPAFLFGTGSDRLVYTKPKYMFIDKFLLSEDMNGLGI